MSPGSAQQRLHYIVECTLGAHQDDWSMTSGHCTVRICQVTCRPAPPRPSRVSLLPLSQPSTRSPHSFLFPALGGLLFGYDIGATSGALLSLKVCRGQECRGQQPRQGKARYSHAVHYPVTFPSSLLPFLLLLYAFLPISTRLFVPVVSVLSGAHSAVM